jgi:type I restriction enzyme S subunit
MSREVPEGWAEFTLGEIFARDTPGFWGDDEGNECTMKVLRATNLRKDGTLNYSTAAVRSFPEKKATQKALQYGDIILERSGGSPTQPVGRVAYFQGGEGFSASNFMQIIRADKQKAEGKFCYYWMDWFYKKGGTELLQKATTGIRNLDYQVYKSTLVKLPPLAEQRRIAEILSSVDEAIQATQAVIEQTRKVKRTALQAALEQPIGLDETQVWPTHNLDELTPKDRKVTYGIVQAGPHVPNGVPYVRVSDMGDRSLSPKGMLRTSPEIAARFTRSTILPGDIVFALRGKIGHVLMTPSSLSGANLTQGTARIAPGERVSAEFLLWALRSPTVESQIKSAVKGSTFKEITLGDLKAIQVPVPPTEIQDAIVQRLDGMEDAIWTAHDHRQALVGLKASLTSDLLTGRRRVSASLPLAAE